MQTFAARSEYLCLQREFGRAVKLLSKNEVANDNKEIMKEMKNWNPSEEVQLIAIDDYSTHAY